MEQRQTKTMSKELFFSGGLTLCVHIGALFLTGSILPSKVVFNIERAPSSVEVFLVPSMPKTDAQQLKQDIKKIEESKPRVKPAIDKTIANRAKPEEITRTKTQETKPVSEHYDTLPPVTPAQKSLPEDRGSLALQGALTEALPDYIKNSPPVYPRMAREFGYEGTVVLNVEVLPEGRSGRIQVVKSSGYSILDNAALKAVREWTFKPASLLNAPIAAWVEIPITFKLKDARR